MSDKYVYRKLRKGYSIEYCASDERPYHIADVGDRNAAQKIVGELNAMLGESKRADEEMDEVRSLIRQINEVMA